MAVVLDDELVAFLRTGCSPIVGCVDADGTPRAMRGWGLDAHPGTPTIRLILDADDASARGLPVPGTPLAVTATSVVTLYSVQLKGTVDAVEPPTAADRARMEEFRDALYDDIVATDGFPRALLERWQPADLLVCTVTVDEVFDQTPGPLAGEPLGPGA